MIAVATNHVSYVLHNLILERSVANVLPSRRFLPNHEAEFVARIEKSWRLWVVRASHDVAVELIADDLRVLSHDTRGHSVTDVGVELVAIEAKESQAAAVKEKPIHSKFRF